LKTSVARASRLPRVALLALLPLLAGVSWVLLPATQAAPGESERIVALLQLRPGMTVADVGAGDGRYSVELARAVGRGGSVLATEIEQDKLDRIERRAGGDGLTNIKTVLGTQEGTGLAAGCCEAILLRLVYHHFAEPAPMRASLRQALRPGGQLLVVDTLPQRSWRKLEGVPDRGGHGIQPEDLVAELTGDGFAVVSRHDEWPGEEDAYAVLFRRLP
jgi:SAM-dependent methyltransferase